MRAKPNPVTNKLHAIPALPPATSTTEPARMQITAPTAVQARHIRGEMR